MSPERALWLFIRPTLQLLAEVSGKSQMASKEAEVMLLTIGLQESGFRHRHQIGGPAHGWWQFERNGGHLGVMRHPATSGYAGEVVDILGLPTDADTLFEVLAYNDVLACAWARLLLWTDSRALPQSGSAALAWDTYMRIWRPGKPRRASWGGHYASAMETCNDS